MKKIICLTCCFVFAGVGSSSEYTLSDSDDNPKALNSSDSSINGDQTKEKNFEDEYQKFNNEYYEWLKSVNYCEPFLYPNHKLQVNDRNGFVDKKGKKKSKLNSRKK